jgi:chemotaxis protein methyltransferase CheR
MVSQTVVLRSSKGNNVPVQAPPGGTRLDIAAITDVDFARFSGLIRDQTGIHLRDHKKQLLVARLAQRLRELGLRTFAAYYEYLAGDASGNELNTLINRVTTNKTSFFREPHHFEFLRSHVIPQLQRKGRRQLRIWSAACSSGEEPYSIAITILEMLGNNHGWDVRILASDIDSEMLEKASAGRYPMESLDEVPAELRRKYFLRGYGAFEGLAQVRPELRRMIGFRRINFIQPDWGISERFDTVFCRNVIIYFERPEQERIVRSLAAHLRPGGYYFSGHSENLQYLHDALTSIEPSIYQAKQGEVSE